MVRRCSCFAALFLVLSFACSSQSNSPPKQTAKPFGSPTSQQTSGADDLAEVSDAAVLAKAQSPTVAGDESPVKETLLKRVELEAAEYREGGNEPLLDGDMQFNEVSMKVLVAQPREGRPVIATLGVGAGKPLKIGFRKGGDADYVQVVGEQLPAFANDRLVMIQLFMESGNDVFWRSMVTALVFLGDNKTRPKVLWQGEGRYQNIFGECETIDVVWFVPDERGWAKVMRDREVAVQVPEDGSELTGDANDCIAKPKSVERIARVKIP